MWTTAKRVRVPSITPCMHTEALTVEITEAACKAVALADNWVRVPAPPRTSSSCCFLRRECEFSARSHTPGHAGATPASATPP